MDLSVSQVCELCQGNLRVGHPDFRVRGCASLSEAGPSELSFLGNEKYFNDYLATAAGVVLVAPQTPESRPGVMLIEVANPSLAFSQICESVGAQRPFEPLVHPSAFVDATASVEGAMIRARAVVEAGAKVGRGTEVGPGVVVERDAVIGEDCLLFANSVVRERCVLGNRVILQPGAVIGSDGFGYEFFEGRHRSIPQLGNVVLADEVEVGANSTVDRARFGTTRIGRGTKIDNLVQIGHNVTVGEHCIVIAQTGIAGSAHLGNFVTIAAQSGVAGHVEIADRVVLASRTGVTKNISQPGIYMGNPALPHLQEKKAVVGLRRLPELRAEVKKLRRDVDDLKQ